MSSFVAEALAASGVTDSDRYDADVEKIVTQCDAQKVEIMTFLKSKYEDFDVFLEKSCSLHKKVDELNNVMASKSSMLHYQIQASQGDRTAGGVSRGNTEFDRITETLNILDILLRVHQHYQKVNETVINKDYVESSDLLNEMKQLLGQLDAWPELEITKTLKVEQTMLAETLKHSMTEDWNQLVRIKKPENDKVADLQLVIMINKSYDPKQVSDLATALYSDNMLRMRLRPLAEVVKMSFDWIVNYPKTVVEEMQTDSEIRLEIKRTTHSQSFSHPGKVFTQLVYLLRQLSSSLLTSKISSTDLTIMSVFRDLIGTVPTDMIVKQCLMPSVPTNQNDLANYEDVVKDTQKFEQFLVKIGFLSNESTALTSYLGNLNVLFANKKCQGVLSQARALMKKELYNTVQLKPGDDCNNWSNFVASPDNQNADSSNASGVNTQIAKLSENTLKFPTCSISETAMKLMELAHELMEEACASKNPASCSHIVYSVRSLFELYTSVVPDYHSESLEQLPQVTALYYNNCMYMSHQLITLASQYKSRLAQVLEDTSSVTFIDLVPLLRALGTQMFMDQIQAQKQELLQCLKSANGFRSLEVKDSHEKAHQAIKQCGHQLEHLKRVWIDVLPLSNYCKAMGHLLASVMNDMINSVLSIEDFSADGASKLHQLMIEVQEMAPRIFPGDKASSLGHVHKHVSCYTKFKELAIVLTAPLQDIVDRWADGKGPLAVEMTAVQVKALIRALFQNTERRSACLNKIK